MEEGLWKRALGLFRKALIFFSPLLFLIQKTCIERTEKSQQFLWFWVSCKIFFFSGFQRSFTKTEIQRWLFLKPLYKLLLTSFPHAYPLQVCSTSFFSLLDKVQTDSSWQVSTSQLHCLMYVLHLSPYKMDEVVNGISCKGPTKGKKIL